MLALYPRNASVYLPMIQRPLESGPHSGQISFPGGAREVQDRTPADTALRETWEEIGVPEGAVRILGALSPLYVAPSNFLVYPYAAWIARRPAFAHDPYEVAQVLEFSLADFMNPINQRSEEWELRGVRTLVPHFFVDGKVIWGASAMILSELLAVLAKIVGADASHNA